jgi:hypothetical protein
MKPEEVVSLGLRILSHEREVSVRAIREYRRIDPDDQASVEAALNKWLPQPNRLLIKAILALPTLLDDYYRECV